MTQSPRPPSRDLRLKCALIHTSRDPVRSGRRPASVIPNELCSEGSRDGETRPPAPRSLAAEPRRDDGGMFRTQLSGACITALLSAMLTVFVAPRATSAAAELDAPPTA